MANPYFRNSSTPRPPPLASTVSARWRRATGVLRIAAGLLVLAALVTQITDQLLNDAFVPQEYFAYFTIESSMMNVVTLIVAGVYAIRHAGDTELLTAVRAAILAYAVVTGSVYNLLLRGIPDTGFQGIGWPNDVLHVIIPVFIALDWLVTPGRARLGWSAIWIVASYPIAWLAFTLLRGLATGWFPYPFLRPDGPGGWGSVAAYIIGIAAFIIALAALAVLTTRVTGRRRVDGGLQQPAL